MPGNSDSAISPTLVTKGHYLMALGAAVVLAVLGWNLRMLQFSRPFGQDEVRHNVWVIEAKGVGDLGYLAQGDFQPILEYTLRKLVWFPLAGVSERSVRLLPLLVSAATVCLVTLVAFHYLKRKGHSQLYALAGAILVGVYGAVHPSQVFYAVEARHYALVMLGSALWFYLIVLSERGREVWPCFFASLFLLNLHFFSMPLVAAAYAYLFLEACWRHRRVKACWYLFSGVLAFLLTITMNFPAFHLLLANPPEATSGGPFESMLNGWRGVYWYFPGFCDWLSLPLIGSMGWYCLLLAAALSCARRGHRAQQGVLIIIAVLGLLVPATIFLLCSKSSWPLADRYFAPFWGLAIVTLIETLNLTPRLLTHWQAAAPGKLAQYMLTLGVLLAGLWPLRTQSAAWVHRPLPGDNFSTTFNAFQDTLTASRGAGAPVLFVHDPFWLETFVQFYWKTLLHQPLIAAPECRNSSTLWSKCLSLREVSVGTAVGPDCSLGTLFATNAGVTLLLLQDDFAACGRADLVLSPPAAVRELQRATRDTRTWLVPHISSQDELRILLGSFAPATARPRPFGDKPAASDIGRFVPASRPLRYGEEGVAFPAK